jgi:SnoaL-like domain
MGETMNSKAADVNGRDKGKNARFQYLSDRVEILDCLTQVSRGIDRFDRELFLSAFHPDASMRLAERTSTPSESFERTIVHLEKSHHGGLHHLLNHRCKIDGDVASAETYFIFLGRNRDETSRLSSGRYIDRLERRKGEWKIARRHTLLECAGVLQPKTAPAIEQLFSEPGAGGPSRGKDDPSYQ